MTQLYRAWRHALAAALLFVLVGCATHPLAPASRPEDVGLSTPRLQAYTDLLQARVDAGEIPGAVLLVARDGQVAWQKAIGWRDREAKAAMPADAVFRIASMTKPVTAVAAMVLVDEGRLRLDDPLSKYLPEFANVQVGVEGKDAAGKPQLALEAPRTPIRIVDLLRHTSGITYGIFGQSMVKTLYNQADLFNPAQTNAEFAAKLSRLPLQLQPGTRWEYSMSLDVLGRVIEVASGMELSEFMRTRIFVPLGMKDTGFAVPPAAMPRLAQPQLLASGKRPSMWAAEEAPRWHAGGHGLVSTAADYARFCQMLLGDGAFGGVRILTPQSARMLHTDVLPTQLPAGPGAQGNISSPSVDNGNGFGLGMVVRTAQGTSKIPGSIGDFGWAGFYGTYFWVDPSQRLFAILMLQVPAPANVAYRRLTREYVYSAVMK